MTSSATRQRDLERLVVFSDAVVAIAATLLVLPLVDKAMANTAPTAGQLFREDHLQLFAFVLSFAVIANFWLGHRKLFATAIDCSPALSLLNMLWLLTIIFLPFPTELLVSLKDSRATAGLYTGTLLVTAVAAFAMDWVFVGTPSLREQDNLDSLGIVRGGTAAALLLLAFVLTVSIPDAKLWPLLLGLANGPVVALIKARRQSGSKARIAGDRSTS